MILRYGIACLAVIASLAVRILLLPYTGTGAPYVVFFAAVLLTSLYGGFGPGFFAVVLTAPIGAYMFVVRAGYPVGEAVSQAVLFTIDGTLVAYLSYLITRARGAAEESAQALRESEEALRHASRHKDEFLAMLSHELRNPLAAIRTGIDMLNNSPQESEYARRAREVIDRQTSQLTALVDDLLDITRIERGKFQLHCERIEMRELVRRTVDDQRTLFDARGIVLEERLSRAPMWVEGDKARLTQVVQNLLNNAAKFTSEGGRVSVVLEPEGVEVILRVRDTGIGIAAEDLPRVFEPFVQIGRNGTAQEGLGLGLALVKGVVELHGGRVDISSSKEMGGSELVVHLPRRKMHAGVRAESTAPSTPTAQRRVLVIEDSPDVAATLAELLELTGYDVRVAAEGASGIAIAKEFRPHVALCDIALPGLDGYEVARRVRADADLDGVVLVALTGRAQPEDRTRALEAGFDWHVAKPATLQQLRQVLEAEAKTEAG